MSLERRHRLLGPAREDPSAGMPSARWIAATAGPFEPSLSMPPFCAAVADVS